MGPKCAAPSLQRQLERERKELLAVGLDAGGISRFERNAECAEGATEARAFVTDEVRVEGVRAREGGDVREGFARVEIQVREPLARRGELGL